MWVSEIMLQQTRVEAVKPFFDRFLARFHTVNALAEAPELDVLTAWSGLGYYSRARNLHRAARQIAAAGLPDSYAAVRALPGVGPYTAAAISSIALGLCHAALDGNVVRVLARMDNDSSDMKAAAAVRRLSARAAEFIDPVRPGDFNQAMMELGATVCTPRNPVCGKCPVASFCAANAAGTQNSLPVRHRKPPARELKIDLLVMERDRHVFLVQRASEESRMAGFWELPLRNTLAAVPARHRASFTHQIVNDRMRISVWHASEAQQATEGKWFSLKGSCEIPVTTVSRKALDLLFPPESR